MISKEDIKRLADLARIEVTEEEAQKLSGEMDAILDYVGQISEFTKTSQNESNDLKIQNVLREDKYTDLQINESGVFAKELIAEFPKKEGDYLKVKKIL